MTNEYWKIKDTLTMIQIKKNEGDQKETVTKNYIDHLSTNVNLMREGSEFGRKQALNEILEFINKSADDNEFAMEDLIKFIEGELK